MVALIWDESQRKHAHQQLELGTLKVRNPNQSTVLSPIWMHPDVTCM
jgi:hypothetical protein